MSQSAMGAIWDGEWESLSDFKLDEWLLFNDEIRKKEVNDSSSKLTKYEIAEQVLHEIEDLGRSNNDYWLDEFPLFDEIQTPKPAEESECKRGQDIENLDLIFDQEQLSPRNGSVVPDIHVQSSEKQDLFSVSYENTATFILSDKNILYINNEPFVSFTPLQNECEKYNQESFPKNSNEIENVTFQPVPTCSDDDDANSKKEMAIVDEVLQNTVLELDQWESDTSRSEVSSDGMTSAYLSPKEREEETDDPDWKPDSPGFVEDSKKRYVKRSKPYWRGGSQEEKKLRKKEQNKNAATRYRQKKKAEVSEILKEEELLKEKKAKLQERVTDIQSEIKCLKALMRDLFKAKGIL